LINRKATNGDTPLHAAAAFGELGMISNLAAAGANINALDCEGRTPLYRAAEARESEAVMLLLSLGANTTVKPLPKESGNDRLTAPQLAKLRKDVPMMAIFAGSLT